MYRILVCFGGCFMIQRLVIPCLLMIVAVGCGGSDVSTVDVSGTVTMDGKPLAGADVNFVTEQFVGYGKTDAQGNFELVQGAAPGPNKVWISKIDPSKIPGSGGIEFSDDPESGLDAGQMEAMIDGPGEGMPAGGNMTGETIPPEYSDPTDTKLTFPVPDGGTSSANFKL